MNNSFHIRRSTGILVLVIAVLAGALVATFTLTRQTPVTPAIAQAAGTAERLPFESFSPLVKRVTPSVVNISSSKVVKTQQQQNPLNDPFFRQFFGNRNPQQKQKPRSQH